MKYDPSLIETTTEIINGQEIQVQKIPCGMSGPNGPVSSTYEETEDDYAYDFSGDPALERELESYMNEGEEPDSDEIRAIKEEIEKEQFDDILEEFPVEEKDWEE